MRWAESVALLMTLQLVAACAASPVTERSGNATLGITRYQLQRTTSRTTVIGLDRAGREVARMNLVHGSFRLQDPPGESDSRRVVGRKLTVSVMGRTLIWETEGFSPTRNMPPHPPSEWALAAFLEDSHVKPLLQQWSIGFAEGAASAALMANAYDCRLEGTNLRNCAGQTTCETIAGATPNTCGGSGIAPTYAWMVHQDSPPWRYDDSIIAQCCPSSPVGPFFGVKSCPDRTDCSAESPCETTCGMTTRPGRCVACPAYPQATDKCHIYVQPARRRHPEGLEVSTVCARWGWSCGDGYCDVDENCESCAADCGCKGYETCGGGGTPGVCGRDR